MMKTNTTMKSTMCAIVATIGMAASAQFIEDDNLTGVLLEAEYENAKRCNDTNRIARLKPRVEAEIRQGEFYSLVQLEPQLEQKQNDIEAVVLTESELLQLSDFARSYYEKELARLTNELAKVQKECDTYTNTWTQKDFDNYRNWKQKEEDERRKQEAESRERMVLKEKEKELEKKARREIFHVRYKSNPAKVTKIMVTDCAHRHFGWDWRDGREWNPTPERCYNEITECDERLQREEEDLSELKRLSPERISKMSSGAQKKYKERLSECEQKVEDIKIRKQAYLNILAANKWPSVAEWKKKEEERKREERRKNVLENMVEEELRREIHLAEEESRDFSEEDRGRRRW